MLTERAPLQFQLSLSAQTRLEQTDDGGLRIAAHGREFRVRAAAAPLASAAARLANTGATEDALCDEALQSGEAAALFSLLAMLRALDASGLLQRSVLVDGRPFATLTPLGSGFHFQPVRPRADLARRLSRFVYVRTHQGTLRIESPLGRARLELHDWRAAAATVALARPCSTHDLEAMWPELDRNPIEGLLVLLENASVLVAADDAEDIDLSAAAEVSQGWWEFHDLLFHMRSRRGRHDAPYGGTYRDKLVAPPPLVKPRTTGGDIIPLPRPDMEALRRTDPPFSEVLDQRRSVRTYAAEPLTIEQLGEFLFRTARYQLVMHGEGTDYALRAAPAGGALHELEVYPVIARCRGLAPGVYHYRPAEHELAHVAPPSPLVERLLHEAWITANRESPLQVYFQITARCQRIFWKYESMAYALILKNLGALYDTMYLVATAMDLAPCALGGGDSDLFAAVAGLDAYEEPAVGEFVLGTRTRT